MELQLVTIPENCVVFREGEPGETFYIVLDGTLAVYRDTLASLRRRQYQAQAQALESLNADNSLEKVRGGYKGGNAVGAALHESQTGRNRKSDAMITSQQPG